MKRPTWTIKGEKLRIFCFTLLVAACLTGLNLLAEQLGFQLDLSYNRLSSLSDATEQLLDGLETPVQLYVMRVDGIAEPQVESVVEQYARRSSLVEVTYIEPDEQPALMQRVNPEGKKITAGSVAVCTADGSKNRLLLTDDFILYGVQSYNGEDYTYKAGYQYEKQLDLAMMAVTETRTDRVVFVEGHGELTAEKRMPMTQLLEDHGYAVSSLPNAFDMTLAQGCAAILLSPTKDITEEEFTSLRAFMDNGGGLMIVQDAGTIANKPTLARLMGFYGVAYEDSVVVADPEKADAYYPGNPAILVVDQGEHPILDHIHAAAVQTILAPQSACVRLAGMERNEMQSSILLQSKPGAYNADLSDPRRTTIERLATDETGVFPVAAAVEHIRSFEGELPNGRLVALGTSGLVNNASINRAYGNAEFALSAVRWLLQVSETTVDVRFKSAQRDALRIPDQKTTYMIAGVLAGIAVLLALLGVVVVRRRKNL